MRLTCLSTFTNFPIMLWSSVSDVAALATYGSFLREKHNSIRSLHLFSLYKVILSWETMHMGAWFSHMLTKGVILTHLVRTVDRMLAFPAGRYENRQEVVVKEALLC